MFRDRLERFGRAESSLPSLRRQRRRKHQFRSRVADTRVSPPRRTPRDTAHPSRGTLRCGWSYPAARQTALHTRPGLTRGPRLRPPATPPTTPKREHPSFTATLCCSVSRVLVQVNDCFNARGCVVHVWLRVVLLPRCRCRRRQELTKISRMCSSSYSERWCGDTGAVDNFALAHFTLRTAPWSLDVATKVLTHTIMDVVSACGGLVNSRDNIIEYHQYCLFRFHNNC